MGKTNTNQPYEKVCSGKWEKEYMLWPVCMKGVPRFEKCNIKQKHPRDASWKAIVTCNLSLIWILIAFCIWCFNCQGDKHKGSCFHDWIRLCHTPVCRPCEQLFLTAAEHSMYSQPDITPAATVCQNFCLLVTISFPHCSSSKYFLVDISASPYHCLGSHPTGTSREPKGIYMYNLL